jgi:hypothetical protein
LIELLWCDAIALTFASAVAILDLDVQWRSHRLGRPIYGLLVLLGLFALYVHVVREGWIPLPGWLLGAFALAYLPFLSGAFIDLSVTDRRARRELEELLLRRDWRQLLHASDERVLDAGRRKLRVHWEGKEEEGALVLELDVHPSLLPVTVSRPHVAYVRDQAHLERIREDILRARARREGNVPGDAEAA